MRDMAATEQDSLGRHRKEVTTWGHSTGVGHKGEAIFAKGPLNALGILTNYSPGWHQKNELQTARDLNGFCIQYLLQLAPVTKIAYTGVHTHPTTEERCSGSTCIWSHPSFSQTPPLCTSTPRTSGAESQRGLIKSNLHLQQPTANRKWKSNQLPIKRIKGEVGE